MGISNSVIGIVIALFIAAILLPPALLSIADANLTGVDTNVQTIFTVLLPILAVIAVALVLMRKANA